MARVFVPHSSHWGAFEAEVAAGTVVAIRPSRHDPDPSPLRGSIVDSLRHRARITQPMVRAGQLDRGPDPDARRSIGRTNGVPSAPSPRDAGVPRA
jgi:biotin/methionine sulfoxide reductase